MIFWDSCNAVATGDSLWKIFRCSLPPHHLSNDIVLRKREERKEKTKYNRDVESKLKWNLKGFQCDWLFIIPIIPKENLARQKLLPLHASTTPNNPLKDKFVNSHPNLFVFFFSNEMKSKWNEKKSRPWIKKNLD